VLDRHGRDDRGKAEIAAGGGGRVGVSFGQTKGTSSRIDLGVRFPNGVAITPDETTLVVCETQTRQIDAFYNGASDRAARRHVLRR